jgi:Animal haem peroxidase
VLHYFDDQAAGNLGAVVPAGVTLTIPNVAPDEGLSASFNSWFTVFGQFFDHGLDLVNKGGSGTVFVPLQPDDPLYVPGSPTNFMVLTQSTVSPGADGLMSTADDVGPVNTTTSFVDQNQTYASHASHQVFLRQYALNADGHPVATGELIKGANGGMATWADVKAQARMLGIELTDADVGNVPLLATDQYGNFIPGANGYAQVVFPGANPGDPPILVEGTAAGLSTVGAVRTGHAFLGDIAHTAVPIGKIADGDIEIGLGNPGNGSTEYDNELLDAHFIAGDGRVNENIGLTAVHHVFHSEHNRLVEHTKDVVLATGDLAFLNEWLAIDVAALPTTPAEIAALAWDGERLFQAAKFTTEMQYQHLVFEEFARKIQPNIDFFVVPQGYDVTIDPSIVAELAHTVYRFGHSMLTESIDRYDPSFNADHIGLIQGFLNPVEFAGSADEAAGAIIRGMTRQVGAEIDEFVTGALRNNLLGLPLDLATINLAHGRDTGVSSLNAARRDFYEATFNATELRPYESWTEFAGGLKNEASIINFIAAYGTHPLITDQTTLEGKRAASLAIIFGQDQILADGEVIATPTDAVDFLNGTGA